MTQLRAPEESWGGEPCGAGVPTAERGMLRVDASVSGDARARWQRVAAAGGQRSGCCFVVGDECREAGDKHCTLFQGRF